MGLSAPGSVVAGTAFQATYSYQRDKSGGAVAIIPGGPRSIFAVEHPDGLDWFLQQLGTLASAPMNGRGGTVTLTAPAQPGQYGIVTVYNPDGGTIDTASLMVTAAPAAAPPPTPPAASAPPAVSPSPPAGSLNPWAPAGAPIYTPPVPEPKASDGSLLSAQGADLQSFYVANYGPGVLAATQFVIDHEHQLSAIGASQHPNSYTTPANEPASSNGEKLSGQTPEVQAYYVQKYGPGFLAASGFVNERNASLGTSVPGGASTVLPAGPGAGGPDTGLGGSFGGGSNAGGWGTGTPTVPNQRQTGQPPPSVSGVLAELTGNKTLLIGAAVAAFFYFGGGRRR